MITAADDTNPTPEPTYTVRGARSGWGPPTFDEARRTAVRHLGDARDWLSGDRAGPELTDRQADAVEEALTAIGRARAALDRAGR